MLDLIQEHPVTAFNMSIWIVSMITSTYYILSMSKTGKTLFEKEIVGLTILILLALCVGQWLNIIALVIYESIDGFIIYMTEYGGDGHITFSVYQIF